MPSAARTRLERAVNVEGTEESADALHRARQVLPQIIDDLATQAEAGDSDARDKLLELMEGDLARSRSGVRDELLIKIEKIRNSGSPMLEALWTKLKIAHAD